MNKDTKILIKILKRTIGFFLSLLEKWERGESV